MTMVSLSAVAEWGCSWCNAMADHFQQPDFRRSGWERGTGSLIICNKYTVASDPTGWWAGHPKELGKLKDPDFAALLNGEPVVRNK